MHSKVNNKINQVTENTLVVGIEPTGHYWMNLEYFLDQYGIPLVMENPMHVKRSKELDDNLPTTTALNFIVRLMENPTANLLVIRKVFKDHQDSTPL